MLHTLIPYQSFHSVKMLPPTCVPCPPVHHTLACSLKPAWIESASQLSGKVKVGAIDCTVHQSTCQEYGVRGYPTIKFFGSNKQSPEDYQGGRDSGSIVEFASKHYSEQAPPREVRSCCDSMQAPGAVVMWCSVVQQFACTVPHKHGFVKCLPQVPSCPKEHGVMLQQPVPCILPTCTFDLPGLAACRRYTRTDT